MSEQAPESGTHVIPLQTRSSDQSDLTSEGSRGPRFEVGEWFWHEPSDGSQPPKLVCLTRVGSNYYMVEAPSKPHGGTWTARVHMDEAHEVLAHEPNPQTVIRNKLDGHQRQVNKLMTEVQERTLRLGLTPSLSHDSPTETTEGSNRALSVMSESVDVKAYEQELVHAKEELLPELFEKIQEEQGEVARWMSAEMLPMKAEAENLKNSLANIDSRIFNVSLYAGLTEEITEVAGGEPAPMGTKLHVMQRRLYMDEECLVNYRHGGMEFHDIESFDQWLVEPENLSRILPFDRCIVAMQVRRKKKERKGDGTLSTALINFHLGQLDKSTFLYIRNGEQVYRLTSAQDFGELIFPDKATFDPSEPVMVKMFCGRIQQTMPVREFEDRRAEIEEGRAKREQWFKDHPYEAWYEEKRQELINRWESESDDYRERRGPFDEWLERELRSEGSRLDYNYANPHREFWMGDNVAHGDWTPFDRSSVYYDDIAQHMALKIQEYNRIALIIQGLFDRSEVLHPHGPVRTWDPASFAENIELVYDGSNLLNYGEAPDIKAYIERCNESLGASCVTVGQEAFWLRKEAAKENERITRVVRFGDGPVYDYFKPFGNPGPGHLARIGHWKPRKREATFSWYRERLTLNSDWGDDKIRTTVTVPESSLFNCDAYEPGDYKQFFKDPRTRAQYLKWAPMLLAAEEYKAGLAKPQEPVPKQ